MQEFADTCKALLLWDAGVPLPGLTHRSSTPLSITSDADWLRGPSRGTALLTEAVLSLVVGEKHVWSF